MSSTKEWKNGTKTQKKAIKANKKQQMKQQSNQQNVTIQTTTTAPTGTPPSSTHYSVNKLTGKTIKTPVPQNNNNNNNIIQNNNNINHKLATSPPTTHPVLPGYENAPKFERSNSFSLRGKLSKLINSITGSKENLTRLDDENANPYKFTRSRSMILLRRSNRRSLIEPQLEQLSEETDSTLPSSPRKMSAEVTEMQGPPLLTTVQKSNKSATNEDKSIDADVAESITPQRQNLQPLTSTPVEESSTQAISLRRKTSSISLAPGEGNAVPFNPIANFQRRRSNTLLASFKSTIATITGEKKKEKLNPKWSASLQSLQAIDNMVSYENMSFIDYDKFNGYEKQLERQLSTLSLRTMEQNPQLPALPPNNGIAPSIVNNTSFITPEAVVRRRKPSVARQLAERKGGSRGSFNFDTDYEHNLDKPRNVYRDSLDSRKLERLNDFSRNSFIMDKEIVDWLNLEDGRLQEQRTAKGVRQNNVDTVDSSAVVQVVLYS
ncbi:unnamed protein product [Ceratitis capitata]|uniref:(Mediterranean fruit fly) hypothetical protein n=1 Tax=Ceratitis capitata TaxID=7213 RepID=A0A811V3J6_CERCA|nr:unnamed protein product [Ceratitis capitata]